MRLLLLAYTLVFPFISYSQQWKIERKNDAFVGKVSVAYTVGYGGEFPYNNPIIAFRKFEDGTITGIITGSGSLICGNGLLTFAFNGSFDDKLEIRLKPTRDSDSGIFAESYSEEKNIIELIEKLKVSNYSEVLFETNCSSNRFKISLSGSSKVLKEVVADYYTNQRDSIKAIDDAKLSKFNMWKNKIDNDIISIYDDYKVINKYDDKKIYSLEEFKTICYGELSSNTFLSEEGELLESLYAYFKSFFNDQPKNYSKRIKVNLLIHNEKIQRARMVDGKIELYDEITYILKSIDEGGVKENLLSSHKNLIFEKYDLE